MLSAPQHVNHATAKAAVDFESHSDKLRRLVDGSESQSHSACNLNRDRDAPESNVKLESDSNSDSESEVDSSCHGGGANTSPHSGPGSGAAAKRVKCRFCSHTSQRRTQVRSHCATVTACATGSEVEVHSLSLLGPEVTTENWSARVAALQVPILP